MGGTVDQTTMKKKGEERQTKKIGYWKDTRGVANFYGVMGEKSGGTEASNVLRGKKPILQ